MLKNYLRVALRTLLKHKSFSAINILGLAAGMPVCLLIILIISEQRRTDQFHLNKDRIYRITTQAKNKATGYAYNFASAPAPLSPALKNDHVEVEDAVRLLGFGQSASYKEKLLEVHGFWAEASYFKIFSFELAAGNRETALQEPFSAVISRETAKRFFGNENPLGQVLSFSFGDVHVTGVLEDLAPGQRTHLKAGILVSFSTLRVLQDRKTAVANLDDWNWHDSVYHYLLLKSGDKAPAVEAALPQIAKKFYKDGAPNEYVFHLQPLTGIALGPELVNQVGNVMEGTVLYIFLIVGFVILTPAIFNYVSLTMAHSLKRAKEIGVRKVVGAQRKQIVGQIICESIVMAMMALLPAVALLDLLLPLFEGFDFVEYLGLDWRTDWSVYVFFLGFSLVAGLLAGLFPAIFLSTMRPAQILKGLSRIQGFSGLTVRKIFLVIQFALSLFFIIATTLFYRQSKFMLNADYGFDKEQTVSVELQDVPYDLFRNELLSQAAISRVSAASHLIGRSYVVPHLPIQSAHLGEPIKAVNFYVSENYLDDLGFQILAGRNFSSRFAADSTQAVILNETAVRTLGFEDTRSAVGQIITVGENAGKQIVGVVKDFHYTRLQNRIEPVVLRYNPKKLSFALVRIAPGDVTQTMNTIEAVWKKFSIDFQPLYYQFLDEFILGAYNDLRDMIVFLGIIAGLAIFVSCLGLLGMAIYSTESRIKEIGIRKVFGASAVKIVALLSQDLVKLLGFAVLFVTPLLWAVFNFMFFENVAYRIEVGPGIFIPGLVLVALLAFATIGSQAIKAARANPVEALRYE